ncbi:NAD(P)H-dependent oxidoreductase [Kiritimatiellaeota bacterium B1221]|nr:NAD(P)H-dependent oxidoreductase [Kiritimatiellaeota bacterium B1221]
MKNILAFSGSNRIHSLNARLLEKASEMAREMGAVVDIIDLRALDLPLYDGDYEEANGLPDGARTLKEAMLEADAFLIASPEYNSFPTPLLLNAIDWASRAESRDEAPLTAFKGKSAGLIAASPGPMGGLRSLSMLRTKLQNIGVTVVPAMAAIGGVTSETFVDEHFADTNSGRRLKGTLQALIQLSV